MASHAQPEPGPPSIAQLLARASAAIIQHAGQPAQWAAAAPGRVNLIGEHTDYAGGLVLPMAIDRACVTAGAPARDNITLIALDLGQRWHTQTRDLARGSLPDTAPSWVRRVLGTCVELARGTGMPPPGLTLAIASSVPIGRGLASSAALSVATARLCAQAMGTQLDDWHLIELCQRAEHLHAGVPCGIMDQAIAVLAQPRSALLIDCTTRATRPIPIPDGLGVLIIETATRHDLAAGWYAQQRQACEQAREVLGVATLADATPEQIQRSTNLAPRSRIAANHVLHENARVASFVAALESADAAKAGRALTESHRALRDDLGVSCDELDLVVAVATRQQGVHGARLTGAGFGGCAIALIDPAHAPAIAAAIESAYRDAFGVLCAIWLTHPCSGAAALPIAPGSGHAGR